MTITSSGIPFWPTATVDTRGVCLNDGSPACRNGQPREYRNARLNDRQRSAVLSAVMILLGIPAVDRGVTLSSDAHVIGTFDLGQSVYGSESLHLRVLELGGDKSEIVLDIASAPTSDRLGPPGRTTTTLADARYLLVTLQIAVKHALGVTSAPAVTDSPAGGLPPGFRRRIVDNAPEERQR